MNNHLYAIIDCNNFFASCECIFRPDLRNKPVIVLSNNDGCVISRSQEAKALGIKMGEPFFKIKHIVDLYNVAVFSANFSLYGQISSRIMSIISKYFADVTIYSIDEAFIRFRINDNFLDKFSHLRKEILKSTDISVSIGISQTKVLAKLANEFVKKFDRDKGIYYLDFFNHSSIDEFTDKFDLSDIWGVGSNIKNSLLSMGISTVSAFRKCDLYFLRKNFNVNIVKLNLELNGNDCIEITSIADSVKKSIVSSRSFRADISDQNSLEKAVSYHCDKVSQKLRSQSSKASLVGVFLRNNYFKQGSYQKFLVFRNLTYPTSSTLVINSAAQSALKEILSSTNNISFKKCGVILSGIEHETRTNERMSFFTQTDHKWVDEKQDNLMKAVDSINHKFGAHSISLGTSVGSKNDEWKPMSNFKSPDYLSKWTEIRFVY